MSARVKFLEAVLEQLGSTVLWGKLDCSELVAIGVKAAGGPDQRGTHTAQRYHDETRKLLLEERPVPADLGFYGRDGEHVIHVVIRLPDGRLLSADGATPSITDIDVARAQGAVVRQHAAVDYRHDVPFLGWRRNAIVDAIDAVER